jgi:hypothetical protein
VEIEMKQLIESGAARIAAGMQNVGANFDFELLSLPGGSLIAVLFWLYASTATVTRHATRNRERPMTQLPGVARGAKCAEGSLPMAECVGCGCR